MMRQVMMGIGVMLTLASPAFAQIEDWPGWTPPAETRLSNVLIGTYLGAAFIDQEQTAFCSGAGTCHEANPLLRPIVERRGIETALIVKGAVHATIVGVLLHLRDQHPRAVVWTLIGLTAAQTSVDVLNYRAMRGGR